MFHTHGRASPVAVNVAGPYGETVRAVYARIGNKAVIEMACAAGLTLTERHDPELATTFGVGEIIRHAAEHGCDEILLGLGGSGTNDCGCGCAAALGVKFYGTDGMEFVPPGRDLGRVARIDVSAARELLKGVRLTVMCDVDNPLCGPAGAAHVFAPQKGADEAYAQGVTAMFGIDRGAEAFEACAHKAADNYRRTPEDVLRLVRRLTQNSR